MRDVKKRGEITVAYRIARKSRYGRYSKTGKYGNKKATRGDIKFDSKKEARRYDELKALESDGKISELRRQVKFELIPKQVGERPTCYYADFTYIQNGELVVEDVKSPVTRENGTYIIKRKLMLYVHNIRIREV